MLKNESASNLNRRSERWSFRQPQPSKQLIHTFREMEDQPEESESPKDLKVISYSNSFSNSDNESMEFISRAQYDYDKLMEHSNGEWRRDSDIIKESLGYYQQQKSRQAEMASGVGEGDHHQASAVPGRSSAIPKFVIDEFEEENYRTNSNRNGEKSADKVGGETRRGDKIRIGGLADAKSVPLNRNSVRASEVTFGKKSTGNLTKSRKVEVPSRPENGLHFKKSVPPGGVPKENQRPNNPLGCSIQVALGFGVGQSQKRRGQSGSILGNILSKYGSKVPALGAIKRRKEAEPLPRIAHELGLSPDAGVTEIIESIRQLQWAVRELESKGAIDRVSNRIFNPRESHVEPSSELIDLYNNQRIRVDNSITQQGSGCSEYKLQRNPRASLSGIDWKAKRLSETSTSLRRTDKIDTTATSRVTDAPEERGRITGRPSRLVNISRFSCVGSNR